MTMHHSWRWLMSGAIVAGVLGMMNVTAPMLTAAPAAQAEVCEWDTIDRQSSGHYHVASAFDSNNNKIIYFGGVDQAGNEDSFLGELDVSDPDPNNASFRSIRPSGLPAVYGAAGFFRPDPDDADNSAAYFIGGSRDSAEDAGEGDNLVYKYVPSSGGLSQANPGGSLPDLLFATAAYDPVGDQGIIYGGTGQCSPSNEPDPDQCRGGTQFGTQALKFDDMGNASWTQLSAGSPAGQIFGATMVYDPAGKRMLLFGGTTDGSRANGDVYELPLDPQIGNWSKLSVPRGPRGRFFHSAAFDASRSWMVVTGGVASGLHSGENTFQDTWALDLSDPANPSWENLGTTPLGVKDRVGATMDYAANHMAVVVHGGRSQFQQGTSQRPTGNSDALLCMEEPPTPTPGPTNTPRPTSTPGGPGGGTTDPWMPPAAEPEACDQITGRVPDAVVQSMLGNPPSEFMLCNPNVPISPQNLYRDKLALQDGNKPYHPIFNRLVWKCGCQ